MSPSFVAASRSRLLLACLAGALALGCDREPSTPVAAERATEPAARAEPPPPNVLWVTIDTLRPDHLSAYGYARDTSPGLEALAHEGVRFDAAVAQGTWTFSSVPSLMTSRYPQAHRDLMVEDHPEAILGSGSRTVASEMAAAGYRTVFVTGHGAIGAIHGMCDGFDECVVDYARAEDVSDRALRAVREGDDDRPLFLWVYYIDPHVPYEAPSEVMDLFEFDGLLRTGIQADADPSAFVGHGHIPGAAYVEGQHDLDWYVAAYDAEIRYTDRELARLRAGLNEARPSWLTMVFADHGESMSEHGLFLSHTVRLDDTILRIPWLLHWPGHVPAGHAITVDVMALDLAPTLLGLLGRAPPEPWQGRDLSGCVTGREPCEPRPAYAVLGGADSNRVAMRRWPDKIVCLVDGSECELFDLRPDPGERADTCADRRERCDALRDELLAWHRSQPAPVIAERVGALGEETRAALRALGYAP